MRLLAQMELAHRNFDHRIRNARKWRAINAVKPFAYFWWKIINEIAFSISIGHQSSNSGNGGFEHLRICLIPNLINRCNQCKMGSYSIRWNSPTGISMFFVIIQANTWLNLIVTLIYTGFNHNNALNSGKCATKPGV